MIVSYPYSNLSNKYKNFEASSLCFLNFFHGKFFCFYDYRIKKLKLQIYGGHRHVFSKNLFHLFSFFLIPFIKKKLDFSQNYFKNVNQIHSRLNFIENKESDKIYQNLKNIELVQFKKEENLEILDSICYFLVFFLTIGVLNFLTNFFINRNARKVYLPSEYNFEKIIFYFKNKPEKVIFRISQIFSKITRFFLILMVNQFAYYKKITYSKQFERNLNTRVGAVLLRQHISKFFKDKPEYNRKRKFKATRHGNVPIFSNIRTKQKDFFFDNYVYSYRAKQLSIIISTLSPAFIKLAQAFASKPEIVGEKIAKQLQRLQHSMPFFSNEIAFGFVKKELGASPDKIFSKISDFPVAAASLGQVYKATLNKTPVAVKIQRPELMELLALDIILIRFLVFWIQKILKIKTDMIAVVNEYASRLFEELDYRKEASNMIKFKSLYGYMDRIYIPKVFLEYSSQRVLVTEWIEGNRVIKDSVRISPEDISLVEIGIRCSLVQLLEVGFLHCDPHGGNLIKTKKDELGYIDFGLVSDIPMTLRHSLMIFILHSINREYKLLAKDLTNLALVRNEELDASVLNFSLVLSTIFGQSSVNFNEFTFQSAVERLFRLAFEYSFVLPPYFLNNLRAIATLEGIALIADPKFRITDVISSYTTNLLLCNPFYRFDFTLEDFLTNKYTLEFNWDRMQMMLKKSGWDFFSNQGRNLSDNTLNFLILSTGNFFEKKILQNLLNAFRVHAGFLQFFPKNTKKTVKIYSENKKKLIFLNNTDVTCLYKTKANDLVLILLESKVYNSKNFFLILKLFFTSSVLVFIETLGKIFRLFIRDLN